MESRRRKRKTCWDKYIPGEIKVLECMQRMVIKFPRKKFNKEKTNKFFFPYTLQFLNIHPNALRPIKFSQMLIVGVPIMLLFFYHR